MPSLPMPSATRAKKSRSQRAPNNSTAEEVRRRGRILSTLAHLYPQPKSELTFNSPYQLVVAVVLSAQCTDKKVNQVTPTLFENYPTFSALARAELLDVESIIRPINYFRTKAKNIVALAQRVSAHFHGELPAQHHELVSLAGVGNKTANVVLSELGKANTFPVDTHVFRLARRLGFSKGTSVTAVEKELMLLFPPECWRNLHHWLIFHGRRICKARNPLCAQCTLATDCPSKNLA